jgi:hypothetical protein
MACPYCDGSGWVCEDHRTRPWEGCHLPRSCKCGGAGAPCVLCNESTGPEDRPALPPGFRVDIDDKGPRR